MHEQDRLAQLEAQLVQLIAEAPADQREYRTVVLTDVLKRVHENGLHEARPANERGRQFAPFAALTGFGAMAKERERTEEPRRMVIEEMSRELSQTIAQLRKGDVVAVTHYDHGAYVSCIGAITQLDVTFRTLRVVRTDISFDDVFSIERV